MSWPQQQQPYPQASTGQNPWGHPPEPAAFELQQQQSYPAATPPYPQQQQGWVNTNSSGHVPYPSAATQQPPQGGDTQPWGVNPMTLQQNIDCSNNDCPPPASSALSPPPPAVAGADEVVTPPYRRDDWGPSPPESDRTLIPQSWNSQGQAEPEVKVADFDKFGRIFTWVITILAIVWFFGFLVPCLATGEDFIGGCHIVDYAMYPLSLMIGLCYAWASWILVPCSKFILTNCCILPDTWSSRDFTRTELTQHIDSQLRTNHAPILRWYVKCFNPKSGGQNGSPEVVFAEQESAWNFDQWWDLPVLNDPNSLDGAKNYCALVDVRFSAADSYTRDLHNTQFAAWVARNQKAEGSHRTLNSKYKVPADDIDFERPFYLCDGERGLLSSGLMLFLAWITFTLPLYNMFFFWKNPLVIIKVQKVIRRQQRSTDPHVMPNTTNVPAHK